MEGNKLEASMRSFSLIPFTTTWAVFCSLSLFALPKEAKIVSGQADLSQASSSGQLQIKTGDKTIIHWKDFSIAKGERLQFLQPSSKSAVLNRVKGGEISSLAGHLLANGKVYLINPSGVIIGKDACIQTADFLASTLDLTDEAFLLGQECLFQGDSKEAIINYGTIEASDGNITLIGRVLDNQGSLSAPQGRVSLLAGQEILLKPEESPFLTIRPDVSEADGTITHTGHIEALVTDLQAEGRAYTYGINVQGSVLALNTVESEGRIYLKAGSIAIAPEATLQAPQGSISMEATTGMLYVEGVVQAEQGRVDIKNSSANGLFYHLGTLDVSGGEGGEIQIDTSTCINSGPIMAEGQVGSGGKIAIHARGSYTETTQGLLAASGQQSGGSISLFADTTLFSSGTHVSQGDRGGEIVVLSPQLTLVSARVDASGTSQGGSVFIGGGAHGDFKGPYNAATTHLSGDTHLSVSAAEIGNAGTLVVWSEERTVCYGSIEANAGAQGGDGGWIEVSSKQALHCNAQISAQAPHGLPGTVLFDPKNITIDVAGTFPQYAFIDPNPNSGALFGNLVQPLSTGNVVITKFQDDAGGLQAGAVYLYNATTAALISTLIGSSAGDLIGSDGVTVLTGNGNYVISSLHWTNNGTAVEAGAVTWGSGITGVSGIVGPSNSLVGSQTGDGVGNPGTVTALSNGNYLVANLSWNAGGNTQAGAVTFGPGSTGVSGVVGAANSVVGDQPFDRVGATITYLNNGDYLIMTPTWHSNAGAATWGSRTSGSTVGVVSAANSYIGSLAGDRIGYTVVELIGNGNYVLFSPFWNSNAGAATWNSGLAGGVGVVSSSNSLVGLPGDILGNNDIFRLSNGNYVVNSDAASNGVIITVGAVTWGDGATGITGLITSSNSLFGSHSGDFVGSGGIVELANGNYVVNSNQWNGSGAGSLTGAVTWGSKAAPLTGIVSASNSIVGSTANDRVGSGGVTALTSGNYVVNSPLWNGSGPGSLTGAVTWASGSGVTGTTVSSLNSLVGAFSSDQIGSGGILQLTNGNYVVKSPQYNSGMGAATWGSKTATTVGAVSSATNSIVGSTAGDAVGSSAIALTNGNFLLVTPTWENLSTVAPNAGAVTFASGAGVTAEVVSSLNSLVGTSTSDAVGSGGVTLLTSGNYVVSSPAWNGNGFTAGGAVTWGSAETGVIGDVGPGNSLVGGTNSDQVGSTGITQLTNGNYVVRSANWTNAGQAAAGAATWGSGTAGVVGTVSSSNSIVGSTAGDQVGTTISTLNNGNFVLLTTSWTNGLASNAGAATWGSGSGGTTGAVSSSNSIVGSTTNDQVGSGGILQLGNGNYVIKSPQWTAATGAVTWASGTAPVAGVVSSANSIVGSLANDAVNSSVSLVGSTLSNFLVINPAWRGSLSSPAGAGAATWGNGSIGTAGVISSANSLIGGGGGINQTRVGFNGATVLSNGNYVVLSPLWKAVAATSVGAVTWGSGDTGIVGVVGPSNSLVGSIVGDQVGGTGLGNGVFELGTTGNFIVRTSTWHNPNGSLANAGAVTWGNGNQGGPVGAVGTLNSIVGTVANSGLSTVVTDTADGIFMVPFVQGGTGNHGQVIAGYIDSNLLDYASVPSSAISVSPSFLVHLLNTGTTVELQSNNDILFSTAITSSGTGTLSLSAGRSVIIDADLNTGNGSLIIFANVPLSSGVVDADRAPGDAVLVVGDGVTLNTGTGDLILSLLNGAGKTFSSSGDLTIGTNAHLQVSGPGAMTITSQQSNIVLGTNANLQASGPGIMTLTAQEKNIVLGTDANLQTEDGTLQLSAGLDIAAAGSTIFKAVGTGKLILLCDTLFPTAPLFGNGAVDISQVVLSTNTGKLLIYTSQRDLDRLPSVINGESYVPGPEFVNTDSEKWGVYYPSSSGIPFTIFYKNTAPSPPPPPPPPPGPPPSPPSPQHFFTVSNAYAAITAAVEPFHFWMNPWYSDTFLGTNIYPPYLTPTIKRQVLPSLCPE